MSEEAIPIPADVGVRELVEYIAKALVDIGALMFMN